MLVGEALVKDGDRESRGRRDDGSQHEHRRPRVRRRRAGLVRRLRWPVHARGAGRRARRARPSPGRRRWPTRRSSPSSTRILRRVRRRPEPALRRRAARGEGRRPDPAQARGPQPHRRPQDPQRARPGAAHHADGQAPGDRRDRRRPARRRQRHRRGVLRPRLHRLHGLRSTPSGRRSTWPGCSCSAPKVVPVDSGSATLKDAINEALRDWVATVDHTAYLFGTAAGPHPFPSMVRDFTRGIGDEARAQCLELYGGLPDAIAACVGGGSNAIGLFTAFLDDEDVAIYGFEPGGDGVETGRHAATIYAGDSGVLHGARTFVLQDEDGQTIESHSISAGLDYPGVGPQHAHLAKTGRATYLPGHRRRGDGRAGAAGPHRGDHPGDRVRARGRRRAATWPRSWPPRGPERSWSTSPAAATRTWSTALEWFEPGPGRRRDGRRQSERLRPPSRRRAPRAAPRWSATCPAGFPDVARRHRRAARDGRRRLRRDRGRAALQRPGHGRPDDPGRRPAGARRRRPHRPTCSAPSRRSPRPAPRPS